MRRRISLVVFVGIFVGCIALYSQSTVACDNTLNNIARNYESCKKTVFDEVFKTLSPLIKLRDALKKEFEALTNLLKNYEAEKEKLLKSIEQLKKEIESKGCVNCKVTTPPTTTTTSGTGGGGGKSCTPGNHPSCRLPNICERCSGLIEHSTGKSLCEVCGCHCR